LISYAFSLATHYTKKFFNHFSHHSTQEAFKVLLIISHLHAKKMASFLTTIKKINNYFITTTQLHLRMAQKGPTGRPYKLLSSFGPLPNKLMYKDDLGF